MNDTCSISDESLIGACHLLLQQDWYRDKICRKNIWVVFLAELRTPLLLWSIFYFSCSPVLNRYIVSM